MKNDVYQIITDRILQQLEQGTIPWRKPWAGLAVVWEGRKTHTETRTITQRVAYSRATGKPYSLLNQFLLGKPGEWASYNQITEAGGNVKKGEKSSVCVFWKFLEKDIIDPATGEVMKDKDGNPVKDRIPYLRYYNVFHVETQCENITPKTRKTDPSTVTSTFTHTVVDNPGTCKTKTDADWEAVEEADEAVRAYVARSGIGYTEEPGSDRAFYRPGTDSVTVPCRAQFKDRSEFYSTVFHELIHSTGHHSRLNRLSEAGDHSFGSELYSKEELVAEIGSACLNSMFEIETNASFQNSAAYIKGWSEALKDDKKMIVSAASRAEKAVRFFLTGELPATTH